MRITWVTRSFLDYRIPVYQEINGLCGNQLTVIYYNDVVPERCRIKLEKVLGDKAIALTGEWRFSGEKFKPVSTVNKKNFRIPYQPGLIRAIKNTNPEILICDGFFQWSYAALWLRFYKKIPLVMCYEGTAHTERNSSKITQFYRKLTSRKMDAIACNGQQTAEYIQSLNYPISKIFLGNMAADTAYLQSQLKQLNNDVRTEIKNKLRLNKSVVIFTGRLVSLKGIDKLIEAWSEVFATNNEISLLIVGDGEEKEKLQRLCVKMKLENIRFTGSVDFDSIYQYLAVSDIFVIPTLQDNWSLVVPEAMACGLPVISSKYNGCWPELVKPENGWVFDPLDAENFIQTLQIAWDNRENWKQMGKESIRIVADYSPEKVAGSIYKACQSVLN
jgi:glycosyltransferase involved in cell wall biosynthesis